MYLVDGRLTRVLRLVDLVDGNFSSSVRIARWISFSTSFVTLVFLVDLTGVLSAPFSFLTALLTLGTAVTPSFWSRTLVSGALVLTVPGEPFPFVLVVELGERSVFVVVRVVLGRCGSSRTSASSVCGLSVFDSSIGGTGGQWGSTIKCSSQLS